MSNFALPPEVAEACDRMAVEMRKAVELGRAVDPYESRSAYVRYKMPDGDTYAAAHMLFAQGAMQRSGNDPDADTAGEAVRFLMAAWVISNRDNKSGMEGKIVWRRYPEVEWKHRLGHRWECRASFRLAIIPVDGVVIPDDLEQVHTGFRPLTDNGAAP